MILSPEHTGKLERYLALLEKWNPAINLVAPSTLAQAWSRHVLDSARLAAFVPQTARTLVDFGSGAGFPGAVLAVLRPDMNVHLIESDSRKCAFLQTISREIEIPLTIHTARIESVPAFPCDILTARALARLKILLSLAHPWFLANPALIALFPKGRQAQDEQDDLPPDSPFDIRNITANAAGDTTGDGVLLQVRAHAHLVRNTQG